MSPLLGYSSFVSTEERGDTALLMAPAAKSALSGESKLAIIFMDIFLSFWIICADCSVFGVFFTSLYSLYKISENIDENNCLYSVKCGIILVIADNLKGYFYGHSPV